MLYRPTVGSSVILWYRKDRAARMPYHGRTARVVVSGGGTPRNHGVEIDGVLVVVPAGNMRFSPPKANAVAKVKPPPPKKRNVASTLLGKVRVRMEEIEKEHAYLAAIEAFLVDELVGVGKFGHPTRLAVAVRAALREHGEAASIEDIVATLARGRIAFAILEISAPEAMYLETLDTMRLDPRFSYVGEGRWILTEWRRQLPLLRPTRGEAGAGPQGPGE